MTATLFLHVPKLLQRSTRLILVISLEVTTCRTPLSFSNGDPGVTEANRVVVTSGAKVQVEMDVMGGSTGSIARNEYTWTLRISNA